MAFLTVNHNDANNQNNGKFPPIAEGTYEAIIKEAELAKSKSGNDMIKVTLVIRDDVKQSHQKRKVWDYLVDTEKTKWKFNQVAKAIGMTDGAKVSTIAEFAKAILFQSVRIEIKHEEDNYTGETEIKERIARYTESEQERAGSDPFTAPNIPASNNSLPF
ncbi:Protein of unknown function DUF669 [uncultured Caudovirales phage]|uniref:DUF669 domain-containing protein n=1 Tax=uncultured Caudovirales phage TaxID=2100421 RepID=A0A6J5MBI5_9CAUD|nr:Protein of unknown function DUF669 [uncultured Caudovirales phage]